MPDTTITDLSELKLGERYDFTVDDGTVYDNGRYQGRVVSNDGFRILWLDMAIIFIADTEFVSAKWVG